MYFCNLRTNDRYKKAFETREAAKFDSKSRYLKNANNKHADFLVTYILYNCSRLGKSGARRRSYSETTEATNTAQLCHIINTYNSRHCSAYAAYGCFCGLRSWGSNPVDGSDRCCRQHDHCFASTGCRLLPLLTYSYHCSGSSCTCRDRNRYSCEYRSCQCDIQLAQCLQTASYSGRYYLYSRRNCR
ncbi:Phospholipase A2, major isoenzyme [Bulinus truncatus]|nr:Phospholipase A2, major isoenzyme [Bulinus truncatus]